MNIAKLNVRIEVEKADVVVDEIGNRTCVYKPYHSFYAYAGTYAADESQSAQTYAHETITFTLRYSNASAAITSNGYRVRFKGSIYNIVSVDKMNYKGKELKLKCQKEVDYEKVPD